jgi:hypothetical protein
MTVSAGFHITDPRNLPDESELEKESRRDYVRQVREMNFLALECDGADLEYGTHELLRSVLLRFRNSRLFASSDAPRKGGKQIMECMRPEQNFYDHTAITGYTAATAERFALCFRKYTGWFDWTFGVFEAKHDAAMKKEAAMGLVRYENQHVLRDYIDYCVWFGDEYDSVAIWCYRPSLFDDFLTFAKTIRFKQR